MDRAEAIKTIENAKNFAYDKKYEEAFDIAISILQTETCEDCVSRQAVDKLKSDIMNWINSNNRGNADYFIVDKIEELVKGFNPTSVQPKAGWIPVGERPPEESLGSVIGWDAYRERPVFVEYFNGRFHWRGIDIGSLDIKAWMPLPEPYKESEVKEWTEKN